MILENNKGMQKEFAVLLKINAHDKEYIVYQDKENKQVYTGIKKNNKLLKINKEEEDIVNDILDVIS